MIDARLVLAVCLSAIGCEEKKSETAAAPSASAPVASSAPAPSAPAPATPSSVATSPEPVADPMNVQVSIRDASAEPSKSVKVAVGGTVTLYLPDAPGAAWSADAVDKALGKPKEETMPGFAKGVNAHQFQYVLKGVKAGETHKLGFTSKKGDKFTLTIETIAAP